MSALIKGIIDRTRSAPGYAGMAVYYENACMYIDILDADLADGLYRLFKDACRSNVKAVTAIMRGYSVVAFNVGELDVVARLEGRYAARLQIKSEDDEITVAEPAACLITREEARREAQELLKSFNLINHD